MEITEQCVVALTWTLKDTLGEELDVLDEPVEFLVGGDDLLKRIEEALQGLLDALEQVVAADQELHGLIEHVQFLAQGVLEGPGQSDHALFCDFHGVQLVRPMPRWGKRKTAARALV